MDLPPPYPGIDSKGNKEEAKPFNNADLPPPPPYEGLEDQRVITQAPINFSPVDRPIYLNSTIQQAPAERIESYLFLSLFTLVCCCFPLGMIATVLSCQVGLYAQRGDFVKARYVSEKAKHVAGIGILVGTFTAMYYCIQQAKYFDPMQLIPFDPKLENVPFGNINEQVHEIGNQTILETPN